jgi:hypothetical protein
MRPLARRARVLTPEGQTAAARRRARPTETESVVVGIVLAIPPDRLRRTTPFGAEAETTLSWITAGRDRTDARLEEGRGLVAAGDEADRSLGTTGTEAFGLEMGAGEVRLHQVAMTGERSSEVAMTGEHRLPEEMPEDRLPEETIEDPLPEGTIEEDPPRGGRNVWCLRPGSKEVYRSRRSLVMTALLTLRVDATTEALLRRGRRQPAVDATIATGPTRRAAAEATTGGFVAATDSKSDEMAEAGEADEDSKGAAAYPVTGQDDSLACAPSKKQDSFKARLTRLYATLVTMRITTEEASISGVL